MIKVLRVNLKGSEALRFTISFLSMAAACISAVFMLAALLCFYIQTVSPPVVIASNVATVLALAAASGVLIYIKFPYAKRPVLFVTVLFGMSMFFILLIELLSLAVA